MLYKNSDAIELTQVEFQIMEFLIKNPNVAIKRIDILSAVWGNDYDGDEKIVDVNVRRLRVKIEDNPSDPKYLATVWGFGYKWTV
jgi:DNA-binding response OmpR family regulator